MLRKLEESRLRNLTEQQRLAEEDKRRVEEAAERKRKEEEEAERLRVEAEMAAAAAAVSPEDEAAPCKPHGHGHPKPAAPRSDDRGGGHKQKTRGSHAMVGGVEDEENAARFARPLHLSAADRAGRTTAPPKAPPTRQTRDQAR